MPRMNWATTPPSPVLGCSGSGGQISVVPRQRDLAVHRLSLHSRRCWHPRFPPSSGAWRHSGYPRPGHGALVERDADGYMGMFGLQCM
jgi:hypothetical protein